jgi:hypothetical protein
MSENQIHMCVLKSLAVPGGHIQPVRSVCERAARVWQAEAGGHLPLGLEIIFGKS